MRPDSAVSANDAMALKPGDDEEYAAAIGTSSNVWTPSAMRKGTGASKKVFTDSIGANGLSIKSHGISNVGGGPVAVAAAGVAVSMSSADKADRRGDFMATGRR